MSGVARSFVGFCGGRSLPGGAVAFVSRVVSAVAGAGRGVATGCAVGGDAAVLRARLGLPFPGSTSGPSLVVFAVGGRSGRGFWGSSALGLVRQAAALGVSPGHGVSVPVSVRWRAGGSRGPLRSRLRARSLACVSFVAGSPSPGFVAFVGGGWGVSPGSWMTVRAAVLGGVPVVVFPWCVPVSGEAAVVWGDNALLSSGFRWGRWCGLPGFQRSCGPGRWLPAGPLGSVWGSGFRWVPSGGGG